MPVSQNYWYTRGVDKSVRQKIKKSVKQDLKRIGRNAQLYLGLKSDIEQTIHMFCRRNHDKSTEAISVIDAHDPFITLNKAKLAKLCSSFFAALKIPYKTPSDHSKGKKITILEKVKSQGTRQ